MAAFAGYVALGLAVAHGAPAGVDLLAEGERARFPALALFLTRAGLFPVYFTICTLTLVFGAIRRAYLPAALILVGDVVVTWLASDAFKALFRRARPDYFYSIHETSYSYASGHAALSLACYGFIAYVVWHAPRCGSNGSSQSLPGSGSRVSAGRVWRSGRTTRPISSAATSSQPRY